MKNTRYPLWLFSLCLLLCLPKANAQYFEAGFNIGASNYLGDLAPSKLLTSAGDAQFAAGLMIRCNWTDWVTLRANFQHGSITGSDNNAKNTSSRKKRNLSFRSTIQEFSLMTEINFMGYRPYKRGRSFAPYLLGGVAIFQFNPQAELDGVWYDLQPLGTEGQGLTGGAAPYKLTQFSIPMGIGLKVALSRKINLGLEFGMRKTFTDHLDDVSGTYPDLEELAEANGIVASQLSWRAKELNQEALPPNPGAGRGDPDDLDWYIFSGINLSYNFINTGPRSRNANKLKCPSF